MGQATCAQTPRKFRACGLFRGSGRERLAKVAERHTRAYPPVYKVIPQVFDKPFLPI
jgi:hypothetical protein